jgi:integrase/recombinase XerD
VSELINIKLTDIDFHRCQIQVNQGKGKKDRIVPFPTNFKELLAMHANSVEEKDAITYLNHPGRKNTPTVAFGRSLKSIRIRLA